MNTRVIFKSIDTAYSQHNGTEVKEIVRKLSEKEVDSEVGNMYEIVLVTGERFDCFADEVVFL